MHTAAQPGRAARGRLRGARAARSSATPRACSAGEPTSRARRACGACAQFGVRPNRELGQNFLIDDNILGVIGRAAELGDGDVVLEVGGGLGVLSASTSRRASRTCTSSRSTARSSRRWPRRWRRSATRTLHLADAVDARPRRARAGAGQGRGEPPLRRRGDRPAEVDRGAARRDASGWRWSSARWASGSPRRPGSKAYGATSVLAQLACEVRVRAPHPAHRLPSRAERRVGAGACMRRTAPGAATGARGPRPRRASPTAARPWPGRSRSRPAPRRACASWLAPLWPRSATRRTHARSGSPPASGLVWPTRSAASTSRGCDRDERRHSRRARLREAQPDPPRRPARASDGLHPLCSIFASIDLFDDIHVEPADGAGDEVECAGLDGPNLAEAALGAFRRRVPELPALRVRDREAHPGRGRARRRQRRRRGGAARGQPHRRRAARPGALRELARRAGLRRAEPDRARHALVSGVGELVEPDRAAGVRRGAGAARQGLSTAAVYAESDRLGRRRARELDLDARCARSAGEMALLPCSATTCSRPRSRCAPSSRPRSPRCARRGALRRARQRLRADLLRRVREPRGGRGGGGQGGRRARRRRCARTPRVVACPLAR